MPLSTSSMRVSGVTPTDLFSDLLPKKPAEGGSEIRSGWQSQSKLSPSLLTMLADQAALRFNGGNSKNGHQAERERS
ncbi:MAG: hypothetical protein WBZ19_11100 [Chthoniobacterales bacterium]